MGAYGGSNRGSQGKVQAGQGILVNAGAIITGTLLPNTPSYLTPLPTPGSGVIDLGTLLVSSGQVVTLQAGDYKASDVTINGNGTLQAQGGQVRIWFSGSLNQSGQVLASKPDMLWLIGSGTGSLNFNGGSSTVAVVYAPRASVLLNAGLFGALICNSATLNSGAALHYDEDLNCGANGGGSLLSRLAQEPAESRGDGVLPQGKALILYPNPSHGETNAVYRLDGAGKVELTVVSLAGETCHRVILGQQEAGNHTLVLDMSRLASGVYLARLSNDMGQGQVQSAWFKLALVR